ncbi:MAG: hypothetical protein PHH43_00740 [Candidatus Cloacimonetes bacterium]|nr:hypothetical protein [Candidatus Cloacimonadota bacterium]
MDIAELLTQLRKLIYDDVRMRNYLLSHTEHYLTIGSAFDVIEDTEEAINAYEALDIDIEESEYPKYCGKLYLAIYGVLQAIFVQQDAILKISEVLTHKSFSTTSKKKNINSELDFWIPPIDFKQELSKIMETSQENFEYIRNIRIMTIGHPTGIRDKDKSQSCCFIVRRSISKDEFQFLKYSPGGKQESETVNVPDLIIKHRNYIKAYLNELIELIRNILGEHTNIYRSTNLGRHFEQIANFVCHVGDCIENSQQKEFAVSQLQLIWERVKAFRDEGTKIGMINKTETDKMLGLISNEMCKLKSYFDSTRVILTCLDATSYWESLKVHILSLQELAKESDDKCRCGG